MSNLELLDDRLPMVAIVGRPNVGKSTLFNRIVGRRKAVVLDTPGVTRDRNFEPAEWEGRDFTLVDTGGYETEPRDATFEQMRDQSLMAVEQADVVVFLTDVREPDNPVDQDVAAVLRRSRKPVLLAVNKSDNNRLIQESYAFCALGFEDQFAVGALNGGGVAELLDRIVELLPPAQEEPGAAEALGTRIAVIGRPNVGKSSLVNALLGRERVIVNPLPGTTRDTIDTTLRLRGDDGQERLYTLLDTAGLRRRGKIQRGVEQLSVLAAQASLRRCDVALVLIDAEQGLTEQDQHIAGYAHQAFRPCVLVVNKWDLLEKDSTTAGAFAKELRGEMGYVSYAPIVMVSAKTGQRARRVLSLADKALAESRREIGTPALNDWLHETTQRLSPPWH